MTRESLGQNQISPRAQPVGAFVQPGRVDVAAPGQFPMMPNPPGMRLIGQASGGSVEGVNQMAELAAALAPFSKGLIQLGATGAEAYASAEYQRGQAEAARAQVQVNQQMQASRSLYAAEGRRLDNADPIGALAMDRVNPWRQAGRQNRLSRIAGMEIGPEVERAYRNFPGVAELPEGAPEIMQLHAQAVQGVVKKYGLDETSPGFLEYVSPQIGQAQQRLYEQHNADRVKHAKETAWREAAAAGFAIYRQAVESGQVEYEVFAPDGRSARRLAIKSKDPVSWQQGVQILIGREIRRLMDETGIKGETQALTREAIVRLDQMATAAGLTDLRRMLLQVDVAPPGKGGERVTAADLYGVDLFRGGEEIESLRYQQAQRAWQAQQRQDESVVAEFETELAYALDGLNEGPARAQATQRVIDKFKSRAPMAQLLKSAQAINRTVTDLGKFGYDPSWMDAALQQFEEQEGTAWDSNRNARQFESLLSTVSPDERGKYRDRWSAIRRRKDQEAANMPLTLVGPIIAAKMKANLREAYPSDTTEAALRGADISAMMAWGNADVARSAQLQHSAYTRHVSARLAEAAAKKGAKLNSTEILNEANKAVREFGSKDKEAYQQLFPGSGRPGAPPSVGAQARPPAPKDGKPAAPRPKVYPSFQLDNMPDREQRLKSGGPVMERPSIEEEMVRVLRGGSPSAAVQRAARDAGMPVGRFLLRQMEAYPNNDRILKPEVRQQLLRSSRDVQGAENAWRAPADRYSPVARRSSWWTDLMVSGLDLVTGARPSYAGQAPWGRGLMPRSTAMLNRQGPGAAATSGPVLGLLASTNRLISKGAHTCTASVIYTLEANGVLDPQKQTAGGVDPSNNPRGLASLMVRREGWVPLPGLGTPRTINSPAGSFQANVMSGADYAAAVQRGQIPGGALVFQTRLDWNGASSGSRGFDVAIARNGGRNHWNFGMTGTLVYGQGTRQVFVLVPGRSGGRR
ncbi:MAG: hypothetical protein FJ083_11125 [Cyanobacteria bacterium K_Offshore_surface_m2_239]|nr:hypothetical protein [Cyanobacteria bacterium K_Offshore_surface_m2_239]